MRPGWTHSNKSADRDGVLHLQPALVYDVEGDRHRGFVPDDRPAATARPAVPDHRRHELLPRRETRTSTSTSSGSRTSRSAIAARTPTPPAGMRSSRTSSRIRTSRACCNARASRRPIAAFLAALHVYALCAPHLEVGGYGNTGYVKTVNGRRLLMARKGPTWMAMGADVPFARTSCGFVGTSDGWTDLHDNFTMDWEFDTRHRRQRRADRRSRLPRVSRTSRSASPSAPPSTMRSRP